MAHQLGIIVVAEGVDNRNQLLFLEQYACDQIQGFYISKPLTAENFQTFVENYQFK